MKRIVRFLLFCLAVASVFSPLFPIKRSKFGFSMGACIC
jgi:hypothetical protein